MTDDAENQPEFTVETPSCPSAADWQRTQNRVELPPPEIQPPDRWQFGMRDMFLTTAAIAVGLAGGNWMSAEVFVGVIGGTLIFGFLIAMVLERLDADVQRYLGIGFLIVYLTAIVSLVARKLLLG